MNSKRIHLLGYQNTARNSGSEGANAMFLPIPAKVGTMSEKNVVDTSEVSSLLDEMQRTASAPLVDPLIATAAGLALGLFIALAFFRQATVAILKNLIPRPIKFILLPWVVFVALLLCGISIVLIWDLSDSMSLGANTSVGTTTTTTVLPPDSSATSASGDKVEGVNTAGIVRRNNLRNMESSANIFANVVEIGGMLAGLWLLGSAFLTAKADFLGKPGELGRYVRVFTAVECLVIGIGIVPLLNWFIATSRDANMFGGGEPIVFNTGIYTVVLTDDPTKIPAVLHKVPEQKRPRLNREIFEAYGKWYKGWTFALCCFNNKEAKTSSPMLWWYEPLYPNLMFFPALDAHDGRPPVVNSNVEVDHFLVLASDKAEGWQNPGDMLFNPWHDFSYPKVESVAAYIPGRIMGKFYSESMRQGDFVFKTSDVRHGRCEPQRSLPPGAAESPNIWTGAAEAASLTTTK